MKMKAIHNRGGFTLMELLAVLAILGVVMFLSTSAIFTTADWWSQIRTRAQLVDKADSAFEQIRTDITAALSPALTGVSLTHEQGTLGDGTGYLDSPFPSDRVIVPVYMPLGPEQKLMSGRVQYTIERDEESSVLVRTTGGLYSDSVEGNPLTIETSVYGFDVQFAKPEGDGWIDEWDRSGLPDAVRINLLMADEVNPTIQLSRTSVMTIHVR